MSICTANNRTAVNLTQRRRRFQPLINCGDNLAVSFPYFRRKRNEKTVFIYSVQILSSHNIIVTN